jgi:hypothetical protein
MYFASATTLTVSFELTLRNAETFQGEEKGKAGAKKAKGKK